MSDRLNTPQLFHLVNGSTVSVALLHSTVCRSAEIHTCARRKDQSYFIFLSLILRSCSPCTEGRVIIILSDK